jgi:hypothetical protein
MKTVCAQKWDNVLIKGGSFEHLPVQFDFTLQTPMILVALSVALLSFVMCFM